MLEESFVAGLDQRLRMDDEGRAAAYPGGSLRRQPVHTCYVPADVFDRRTPAAWGAAALAALDAHGPLPGFEDDPDMAAGVRAKLAAEPIEDVRIDLEDGYGVRPDDEEDAAVRESAGALRAMVDDGSAPPFSGIRMKCLEGPVRRRGIRSLDLFLEHLLTGGALPPGFRVTLPKVTSVA